MISQNLFTFAIIVMAVITFLVRYVFFTQVFNIKLTPPIQNLLIFTAPCVLTAMFIPIMFQDGFDLQLESFIFSRLLTSSYFWASIFALISSLFIRQTLVVIILSMGMFYTLRLFVFS